MPLPTAAAPDQVCFSHCLLDAGGRRISASDPGRAFYAASTIKLHVLLAALQAADRGVLDLAATVAATRTFIGANGAPFTLGGDHLDPTHPADGKAVGIRELLMRMIDRSSNEATNHVVELVGLDAVTATISSLGLTSTRVERLIGDQSALDADATNETSTSDLAVTMLALVKPSRGTGLSPSAVDLARAALRTQRIPVIAKALRDGLTWGSKSGWVPGYRHDVAYIGAPDADDLRVLAVMTTGMGQDEADEKIAELVRNLLPGLAA